MRCNHYSTCNHGVYMTYTQWLHLPSLYILTFRCNSACIYSFVSRPHPLWCQLLVPEKKKDWLVGLARNCKLTLCAKWTLAQENIITCSNETSGSYIAYFLLASWVLILWSHCWFSFYFTVKIHPMLVLLVMFDWLVAQTSTKAE